MSGLSSDVITSTKLVSTKFALTAPQTAMWLPQVVFPGKPVANNGAIVTIEGALDPWVFDEAIRRLVEETDALRLSFWMEGETVHQQVREQARCTIEHVNNIGFQSIGAVFHCSASR